MPFVECGMWNGAANGEFDGLFTLGEHLSGKQGHLEIEFDSQLFPKVCYGVKSFSVLSVDMDGDYVALVFYCFVRKDGKKN